MLKLFCSTNGSQKTKCYRLFILQRIDGILKTNLSREWDVLHIHPLQWRKGLNYKPFFHWIRNFEAKEAWTVSNPCITGLKASEKGRWQRTYSWPIHVWALPVFWSCLKLEGNRGPWLSSIMLMETGVPNQTTEVMYALGGGGGGDASLALYLHQLENRAPVHGIGRKNNNNKI